MRRPNGLNGAQIGGARVAAAAAVVVLAVGVAAVMAIRGGTDSSSADGAPAGTGSSSDAAHRVSPARPPKDGVRLPRADGREDGMPDGFPHTDLGAVATATAVARLQLGFDYDQAAEVAEHFATAQDRDALVARSRTAVTTRRQQAGLPAGTSSTPAPAAYAVTPVAYVVKKLEDNYYAVSLLSYITLTNTSSTSGDSIYSGTTGDSFYSGTSMLRWEDGDWKVAVGSSADIATLTEPGLPATSTPGSKEYRAAGWLPIAQGDE